ncbi:mandelate racemase/muconate lactonizing enzyme family protein [Brevibacterium zhoupengii]|uniref:mandelate racemase/muconate lactonizing enzyme family protein n=1 Tax=Brevibacterium zhoupengii TaxID=2898795 RepID=UPI001F0994C0|nr:mandelate racemase/muconate lactonizing enzyme family protein [Brevibacterium zhoupengii]
MTQSFEFESRHLKIAQIDLFGYDLTYAHGEYMMSGDRGATKQQSTVVRITTDSGVIGWGEVAPLGGTYLPTFSNGIRAAIKEVSPSLIGHDPTNTSLLQRTMDSLLLDQHAAKSAVDIAAWDIKGQAYGTPVSTLLGGTLNSDFGLYEAVSLDTPKNMVAFVRKRLAAGIESFQLKVGNEPHIDVQRTRAISEAIGSQARIIADANGGWDLHDAMAATRGLEDLPVYIEQPCRRLDDCTIVQSSSKLPLILDECVVTLDDLFRTKYEAQAVAINIKLNRVGGLTKAALIRDTAQELGLKVSIEDTWGGDLSAAAVSHLAASTRPESLLNVSFYNDWNLEHIAGYRPRLRNGRGSAPTSPGLGVSVDSTQLVRLGSFN